METIAQNLLAKTKESRNSSFSQADIQRVAAYLLAETEFDSVADLFSRNIESDRGDLSWWVRNEELVENYRKLSNEIGEDALGLIYRRAFYALEHVSLSIAHTLVTEHTKYTKNAVETMNTLGLKPYWLIIMVYMMPHYNYVEFMNRTGKSLLEEAEKQHITFPEQYPFLKQIHELYPTAAEELFHIEINTTRGCVLSAMLLAKDEYNSKAKDTPYLQYILKSLELTDLCIEESTTIPAPLLPIYKTVLERHLDIFVELPKHAEPLKRNNQSLMEKVQYLFKRKYAQNLIDALLLVDFTTPKINRLLRPLCENQTNGFMISFTNNYFHYLKPELERTNAERWQVTAEIIRKYDLDPNVLYNNGVNIGDETVDSVSALQMEEWFPGSLQKGIQAFANVYSYTIASYYWHRNEHLDLVPKAEEKLMQSVYCKGTGPEVVAEAFAWFKTTPLADLSLQNEMLEPIIDALNWRDPFVMFWEVSDVALRYFYLYQQPQISRRYAGRHFINQVKDHFKISSEEILEKLETLPFTEEERIIFYLKYADSLSYLTYKKLLAMDFTNWKKVFDKAEISEKEALLTYLGKNNPLEQKEFLLTCLSDKSKQIRTTTQNILIGYPELQPELEKLKQTAKKVLLESLERILTYWETAALDEKGFGSNTEIIRFALASYNKKMTTSLKYLDPDTLPVLTFSEDGAEIPIELRDYYLNTFINTTDQMFSKSNAQIREAISAQSLAEMSEIILERWLDAGATAKQRGALIFAITHGNDALVLEVKKLIDHWITVSRGAIASEAARAMALNGSKLALVTVDSMAQKFKNKQVQRAAKESIQSAADAKGISVEELSDKIVPDLGFKKDGTLLIDYGTRKFKAILLPTLEIVLETEEGKAIKSLPKPNTKDNEELANQAKKDFTTLKKTLKAVISTQKNRLEQALVTARIWNKENWVELFVNNPIMHQFATGLIWGAYERDGTIIETFRYLEDGTFNTVEEEEFELHNEQLIRLIHPLDLTPEQIAQWIEQLDDYEIVQPFEQIARQVFLPEPSQKEIHTITDFQGLSIPGSTLTRKLEANGWVKGPVQDGGSFLCMLKFYPDQKIVAHFGIDNLYIGSYEEDAKLVDTYFYSNAKNEAIGYWGDVNEDKRLLLGEVPPRIYSETMYDLERLIAPYRNTEE